MNCFKTVWYWFSWFLNLSTGTLGMDFLTPLNFSLHFELQFLTPVTSFSFRSARTLTLKLAKPLLKMCLFKSHWNYSKQRTVVAWRELQRDSCCGSLRRRAWAPLTDGPLCGLSLGNPFSLQRREPLSHTAPLVPAKPTVETGHQKCARQL